MDGGPSTVLYFFGGDFILRVLKIGSLFIISIFVVFCASLSVFADSCDVNPIWDDYLMDYWIVFEDGKTSVGSEFKRQLLITSSNEFYLYPDENGEFCFSSSQYELKTIPLHSVGVYYYGWNGDGYDVTNVVSVESSLSVIESYHSNFDIKYYTSDNQYDLILPKTTSIVGIDITDSMGSFRYDMFKYHIPLLVSVGICIFCSFIAVFIIKRVIYNFV